MEEFKELKQMSLGNRLMLVGHLLNGIALTLITVGTILRDGEEVPREVSVWKNGRREFDGHN